LDWERAVRCIRHALRTTPSPDWWRRVLVLASPYRPSTQGPTAGAVFSTEMICEATIDRIVELLKLTNSGNDPLSLSLYIYIYELGSVDTKSHPLNWFNLEAINYSLKSAR